MTDNLPEKLNDPGPMTTQEPSYSYDLIDKIADQIIAGRTVADICRDRGMPSSALFYKWFKHMDGMRERILAARQTRAIAFEDEILSLAQRGEELHKDSVPGAALKFNALKWLAEVNDSGTFGKKTTVEGNPDKPIKFEIVTGFGPLEEHQKSPLLGKDGLIQKVDETIIEAEVVHDESK